MGELADHLAALAEQTDEVRVVMLTGGLDGYFIAHADLDDLAKLAKGEPIEGDLFSWSRALHLLESMPQPTVAAIDGQAWGGGCETSLACTMRIGSERAHLGQPEVVVGIIPGAGGTQRLPRLVGGGRGAELCLTRPHRRRRGGRSASACSTRCCRPRGSARRPSTWCQQISRHPGPAVFAAKRAVVEGLRGSLDDGLRLEGELFLALNASDDAKARNAAVSRERVRPRRRGGQPDGVRPHDRRPAAAPDAGPRPRRVRGRLLRASSSPRRDAPPTSAARPPRWRPTSTCSPASPSPSRGARW